MLIYIYTDLGLTLYQISLFDDHYVQLYFSFFSYQFIWERKSKISLPFGYLDRIRQSEQFHQNSLANLHCERE